MIIDTDQLWPDDRRRLADLLAGLPPTDSLYDLSCRLQNEAMDAMRPQPRDGFWTRMAERAILGVLDVVDAIRARGEMPDDVWEAFERATIDCTCGHGRFDHEHYTSAENCSSCDCVRFEVAR